MTTPLDLYLVQTQLTWQNSTQNLLRLGWHIQRATPHSLIVLPEMFSTGFTMNPSEYAETMDGLTVNWMKELSADRAICGSVAIKEDGKFYNRFIAVYKGEIICVYNKQMLFSYGQEHLHYSAGTESVFFVFGGWKIVPFICYDLRFPHIQQLNESPDLMLFVANWPSKRMLAWNTLLRARAVENVCYVAGVNRVGEDGNGIKHNGCSQIIDFSGEYRVEPIKDNEILIQSTLEMNPMTQFREKFPFLSDKPVY